MSLIKILLENKSLEDHTFSNIPHSLNELIDSIDIEFLFDEEYVDSFEELHEELFYYLQEIDQIGRPLLVYRTLHIPSGDVNDIDKKFIGESWSWKQQSALNFAHNNLPNDNVFVVKGSSSYSDTYIDWVLTVEQFFINSYKHGEYVAENEIAFKQNPKIINIKKVD